MFKVKFNHPRLGEKILNFKQVFYITPNQMLIYVFLVEPATDFYAYEQCILISSERNQTKVETKTSIEIRYKAPNIESIHDKIDLDTANGLENGRIRFRKSMKSVIEEYKDQTFSFTLKS